VTAAEAKWYIHGLMVRAVCILVLGGLKKFGTSKVKIGSLLKLFSALHSRDQNTNSNNNLGFWRTGTPATLGDVIYCKDLLDLKHL